MSTLTLTEFTLPMDDSWDVIVVGGGPAGCTAAAAAAREGARTLLLEATGALGGMGTNGLVPAWCPFSDVEKVIYRGMAEEVLITMKAGMPHIDEKLVDWVPIDPELLKRIYDDLVTHHGAHVLFFTSLAKVQHDEQGTVTAIITANKHGLTAYRAKTYIDCTGDGDLAAWAGAAFEKGDAQQQGLMPATHCFVLSNVDGYGYQNGPRLHGGNPNSPIYKILTSGKYPEIPDAHCCNSLLGPGTVGFNAGHLFEVDNTDPTSLSQAMMLGRKIASAFRDALAEYHPAAFANAFLVSTGSLMGIRETRRIIGDYMLTLEDYIIRRSFSDEICRNSYYIDIHNKSKDAFQSPDGLKAMEKFTAPYSKGESHGIPYRCLTPKTLTNVLVAGRSISCDQTVQGSVRVMPTCLAMGEAAGIAAAHTATMPTPDVHQVDVARLRARLREEGGYLPEAEVVA